MDKSTLEEFLKLYPNLDNIISTCQKSINNLQKLKDSLDGNKDDQVKIDDSINLYKEELKNMTTVISLVSKLKPNERKIIDLRFWKNYKWEDVAVELKYHVKSIERIYGKMVKNLLIS